ncbi:peptidylprolyl isomerase [Ramlibacter sp.]|uniref:peptidylprolyl isomerase n=1 Tax=Ramlibacter sp. TaxID=1917967 RepID=UPI002C16EF49|nr:peptidylprolyl isomerase [Ramlibacter sp.]HWI80873.1 peptidylprolyl isomerase [Ramlibacter sp.]
MNGIALHAAGERPDEPALRERAWSELLRQEAVRQGLLPRHDDLEAPALSAGDRQVIEQMLDRAVPPTVPTDDECRRHYEARRSQFVHGAQVHARHILFAVTAGVDVNKLAARAEQALLELTHAGADSQRFGALARELSNCPSGAAGGDLGWFGPQDCAPELANELFRQHPRSVGLRPRLVHSRYGLHIVDVVDRRPGRQLAFEQARDLVAMQLAQQSRARALHQYMQLLAGRATIEGVALAGADSPLVQ